MSTVGTPGKSVRKRALEHLPPEAWGNVLGLATSIIWGSFLAMSRAGVSAGLTASDIAFIRYGVAGFILLPWLIRNGFSTCGGVGWGRGAALAVLIGPPFILIGVGGYSYAPLAHGAVLQPAALTIGSMLLAALVLADRAPVGRIVGIGIIIAGLVIIAGPGLTMASSSTPIGDAMFITAGLMWAVFTVVTKLWSIAALPATAALSVISATVFVPIYMAGGGLERLLAAPIRMLVFQVLVQGVLSGVVAVLAFSRAIHLLGASRAAVFPALVPAVAIVLGVPITGEIPTLVQLVGLAVVSAGFLFALGIVPFNALALGKERAQSKRGNP